MKHLGLLMIVALCGTAFASPYVETFDGYADGTVLASRGPGYTTFTTTDGFYANVYSGYDGDYARELVVENGRITGYMEETGSRVRILGHRLGQNDDIVNAVTECSSSSEYKVIIEFTGVWNASQSGRWYGLGLGDVTNNHTSAYDKVFAIRHSSKNAELTLANGTTINPAGDEFDYHSQLTDWYVEIDPYANSGDGSISVKWKKTADTEWTVMSGYQDLNLGLLSNSAISDPATWADYTYDITPGAYLDGVSIYSTPEPATLSLLGLGGLGVLIRRKR